MKSSAKISFITAQQLFLFSLVMALPSRSGPNLFSPDIYYFLTFRTSLAGIVLICHNPHGMSLARESRAALARSTFYGAPAAIPAADKRSPGPGIS